MANAEPTKICASCGAEKPHSAYYCRGDRKAPRSHCKACMTAKRAEQSERHRRRAADWRAANLERARTAVRSYRAENRDEICRRAREQWRADPSLRADDLRRVRVYRQANRELVNAQNRARRAKDPEAMRAWYREYRRKNRDAYKTYFANRKALKNGNGGRHTFEDIQEIRRLQRDRCAICKTKLNGGGELDHIVPLSRGGSNDRRNLQWTCKPCNCRKRASDPIDFMQRQGLLL